MSSLALHNALFKSKWNVEYPIGRVVIFYDTSDHSNYLGFKWERCSLERSPIGYNPNSTDSNYKAIGNQFGEKEHKLTTNEMPSHNHSMDSGGTHSHSTNGHNYFTPSGSTTWTGTWSGDNWGLSIGGGAHTHTIKSTGGNASHNNIHPVEVMAFWRRIA